MARQNGKKKATPKRMVSPLTAMPLDQIKHWIDVQVDAAIKTALKAKAKQQAA